MKYEYLPHTADAKFKAYGKTLEEQFTNAALAMTNIMLNPEQVKPKKKKNITIKGEDLQSLLYNFLEELLFLLDTKFFILNKIEKIKIENNTLRATLLGDNAKNYKFHGEVKAMTYNDMEIKQNYVQVVVDL